MDAESRRQLGTRIVLAIAVAAIGLLALGAGGAAAATVSVKKQTVTYKAAKFELNRVTVVPAYDPVSETANPGNVMLVEGANDGTTIEAGAGCTPVGTDSKVVSCFAYNVIVKLGDGSDNATVSQAAPPPGQYLVNGPVTMKGEKGDDVLVGGNGNDTLSGSAGNDTIVGMGHNDRLIGGGGNDYISGADNVADEKVSCGGGIDTLFVGPPELALPADHLSGCEWSSPHFLVPEEQAALG
jgi:hypothetical protein